MIFSDRYLKNIKADDKVKDVREGRGFGIRVFPSGEKTFFYIYRIEGKRKYLITSRTHAAADKLLHLESLGREYNDTYS